LAHCTQTFPTAAQRRVIEICLGVGRDGNMNSAPENTTPQPRPESPEDDAEFERVLRNLVNTPHKPHSEKGSEPKPAPKKSS
jgi:hypothetical protein